MGKRFKRLDEDSETENAHIDDHSRMFCSECPKHARVGDWCCIMAKMVPRGAAACRYGRKLIAAERHAKV